MPKFTPKRFEQIFSAMVAKVVSRTELSDITDSSVIKHILAAAARQDDEQYFQMTLLLDLFSIDRAKGDDLDERAKDIQPAVVFRRQARNATGAVVFSRATASPSTVTVPSGSKVKTADGQVFTTVEPATITQFSAPLVLGHGIGRDSGSTNVVADVPGVSGNVVANTIIKFTAKPSGVDSVTNVDPCLYGEDVETDDAFRTRLRRYITSLPRSTVGAIQQGVLGVQDPSTLQTVLFTNVIEDDLIRGQFTVYIDDGTGAAETTEVITGENVTEGLAGPPPDSAVGGEVYLYLNYYPIKDSVGVTLASSLRGALTLGTEYTLNPTNGQLNFDPPLATGEEVTAGYTRYTGLIAYVQKVLDGDPADRTNFPGYRAAGTLGFVRTPQVLLQSVNAIVTVVEGYIQADVKTAAKDAIKRYINGLPISGDVLHHEITTAIMGTPGVYNVVLNTPATDVVILDDQLARVTDGNIILT